MLPSLKSKRTVFGLALLSLFAIGVTAKLALAQETKCYLMVCTGSVCVANQIPCPKTDPTKPAPDPGAG